jgi:hypothetical protein
MDTAKKIKLMAEVNQKVIDYLEGQKSIFEEALTAYDNTPIQDSDAEVRRMRETEAIKLRDRVNELRRHIAVVKLMVPNV